MTKAPKLMKEMGLIDWSKPAEQVCRQVRAMQPWPMPYTLLPAATAGQPQERFLILKVCRIEIEIPAEVACGTILPSPPHRLFVRCGGGVVEVLTIQAPGKRAMSTKDYLQGHPLSGQFIESD